MTEETASPGTHFGTGESEEPGGPAPPLTHTQSAPVGAVWRYRRPDLWGVTVLSRGLASGGMSRIWPVPCVLGGHVTWAGLGWAGLGSCCPVCRTCLGED